jgi:flagellar basal-body rod modification protein FlgD
MSTLDALTTSRNTGGANPKGTLEQFGSDQFLTLMLAQLRNQDPMKPLEPTEFIGQLAQFTTVSGIREMQGSMSAMADSLRSAQTLSGAQMVGRDVLSVANTGRFDGVAPLAGAVDLPEGTRAATILVRDSAGQLMGRVALAPGAGTQAFSWNGERADGSLAPPGRYQFEAVADIGGRSQSMEVMLRSRVDSVTLDANGRGLILNTPNGSLALGAVRQVM